ncbi:MAG: acireductone synthase [Planctomycetes bacterium]|nr:acireductone synthase [Planctomycetota bacterium]
MIVFDGRAILLDVEGTTSSIAFVVDVLFPFARAHAGAFLAAHRGDADLRRLAADLRAEAGDAAEAGDDWPVATARAALALMDRDAKTTALKTLQGMVWRHGFESGELVAHVYDDVPTALAAWADSGLDVRIYSSGSVEAQKLFFGHTAQGDLTRFLRGHYDTTTGPKRAPESYRRIAADIGLEPRQILFVSDVGAELDAARAAGMATAAADRPGNRPVDAELDHDTVTSFAEIVT